MGHEDVDIARGEDAATVASGYKSDVGREGGCYRGKEGFLGFGIE